MMLCRNPYVGSSGMPFGCGQCMPCRVNRRRIWAHRIMLEAAQHESNSFVTLTYSDESLPSDGSLRPVDVQKWLKRLRERVAPSRFRFYAVGEYGDDSWRPHYHAALFGFPSCAYGQSRYNQRKSSCCHWCDLVRDTWQLGHVFLGSLEDSSAQYICGYVTKKMSSAADPRLEGRHPEFARMSLRPGIGHSAMWEVADILMRYEVEGDVPLGLNHGKRLQLLGRYLRSSLRKLVGRDGKAPQEALDELAARMLPLRLAARSSASSPSVKDQVLIAADGKFAQFEARRKLYRKGKSL